MAQGTPIQAEHLLLDEEKAPANDDRAQHSLPMQPPSIVTTNSLENDSVPNRSAVSMKGMDEQLIFAALRQSRNNRTQAAQRLGISVRTLRNKLKLYRERNCAAEVCNGSAQTI